MEAEEVVADLLGGVGERGVAGGDEFADSDYVIEDGGGGEGDVVVVGGVDENDAAGI